MRKKNKFLILGLLVIIVVSSIFIAACDKPKKFDIEFDTNGGSAVELVSYTEGETLTLPVPEKKGYAFAGWYNNEQLKGNPYFVLPPDFTGNQQLYAAWAIAEYKINYNLPIGASLPIGSKETFFYFDNNEEPVTDDTPLAATALRGGYDFLGWYAESDFTGDQVYKVPAGTDKNFNVYPKFEAQTNTIHFVTNCSQIIEDKTYKTDQNVLVEDPEDRPYFKFVGWFRTIDFSGDVVYIISRNSLYGNYNLYACWIADEFSIDYVLNGGAFASNDYPKYCTYDGNIQLASPEKRDFAFGGWYDNPEFDGSPIEIIPEGITDDITYYAKWVTVDNKIEYSLNGGSFTGSYPQGYKNGESINLVNPRRTGYTFLGWYETENFSGEAVTKITTVDTGDKKFYARWEITTYSITFVLNGGSFTSTVLSSYTINSPTINLESNAYRPTKSGFDFVGWYTSPDFNTAVATQILTGSTGDKVFYASYQELGYIVTFYLNGGSLGTQSEIYSFSKETSVPLPEKDPTRFGYTFGGWFNNGSLTEPNTIGIPVGTVGDRAIYAKWIPIVYNITYNLDGGTLPAGAITSYSYDSMTYLPSPTKAGVTFGGWYTTPNPTASMTDGKLSSFAPGTNGNKTLYALWLTPINYSNSLKMEAENTDLTGKVGAGGSGSALEGEMVSTDGGKPDSKFPDMSGIGCIPWTWAPDISIEWEFTLDRAVTEASLLICFGNEIGSTVTFTNETTAIYINGKLYQGSWSCTVDNQKFSTFTINLGSEYTLYAGYNVISIVVLPNDLSPGIAGYGPVFDYIILSTKANISWTQMNWKGLNPESKDQYRT